MGRKTVASHRVWSGVNIGRKEAVAHLLEAVSSFVTDLTECPSDGKTRKLYKIVKMINQPLPPSKEEYISANNISDDSAMDSEENEVTDEDDDDRNHKHRRRESSRLPVSNENSTPAEEPSTLQLTKKRVRPFEHSSKFDKRRFRSNNPFHGRGRGRNNNNNNHSHPLKWAPPPLEMHDLAMMASSRGVNGSWGGYGFVPGIGNGMMEAMHHPRPMGPGIVGPAMMELGLPRQRCPDFEELGYCLRGDMCPMEHGVNRIVVEDVQSLSQLKLLGVQPDPVPKPVTLKDPLRPNVVLASVITAPDADVYDPDQPLWANGQPMASPNHTSAGTATGASTNDLSYHPDPGPSVWGRIGKTHKSHGQKEHKSKADNMHEDSTGTGNIGAGRQRASRTLYICGVPQKDNRSEALFSHFKKFGRVIDIYIPSNSEKAFVQFSKKEEAEAALLAPDAVMGNRFIKVLWANRDRFSDEAVPMGYHPKPLPHMSQAPISDKGKGSNLLNLTDLGEKGRIGSSTEAVGTTPKVTPVNRPKVGAQKSEVELEPAVQKKQESMELLEELRKKQEILARKRDDFRRQLQMLEKQASGGKRGENSPTMNRSDTVGELPKPAPITPKNGNMMRHEVMHTATRILKDPLVGPPNFRVNRFKIDNRPVQFRILPPLAEDISDISILKEHFSSFGEVTSLEVDKKGTENEKETEVRVTYTTHEAAEKAYFSGTSLRGHNLIFKWIPALSTNTRTNGNSTGAVPHKKLNPVTAVSSSPTSPVQTEVERSVSPAGDPTEPVERKDDTADLCDISTNDRMDDADAANSGAVQD